MGKRLVILALCVAAVSLSSAPALAATETPFTATATFTQVIPGRSWNADGVVQIRDQISHSTLAGDIVGTREGVFNRAGERVWGEVVITTASVTWHARFQGTFESGCGVGSFVGPGSDGSIISGTFACTAVPGVQLLEGVILNPTG